MTLLWLFQIDEDGTSLTDKDAINVHIRSFFSELYTTDNTQTDDTFTCTRVIPEDCELNNGCMEEITSGEIVYAIKNSQSRKFPGPNGIPKEFYLRAFDVIERELGLVINEALRGEIPRSFVNGVIVLVRKKGRYHVFNSTYITP